MSYEKCNCDCHHDKNIRHVMPCCQVCKYCKEVQGFGHLHEKADGIFFREDELEPKYFIGLNEKTGKLQYVSESFV